MEEVLYTITALETLVPYRGLQGTMQYCFSETSFSMVLCCSMMGTCAWHEVAVVVVSCSICLSLGSRWSRKSVLAVTACRCLATPTVSVIITLAGLSWCDGAANYGIVEQRKRERWMILLLRLYVLGARS